MRLANTSVTRVNLMMGIQIVWHYGDRGQDAVESKYFRDDKYSANQAFYLKRIINKQRRCNSRSLQVASVLKIRPDTSRNIFQPIARRVRCNFRMICRRMTRLARLK
jgi:hypothetical protein